MPVDDGTSGQALITDGSGNLSWSTAASGDVYGPASATDNALARFDLTTGKLIQNSVGILSDAGILTGLTGITSSGPITLSSLTSGRVTYAGTAGLLQDSANLTFNGTTLTANTIGAYTLGGTIAGGGNQINNVIIGTSTPLAGSFTTINASTSITNAGLTSGRVTYAGASGLLSDSANLTWSGSSFQAVGTVYVGNGQSAATLGGTTATAGGLTDKDLTLSAWYPTSGTNDYGGDLYLSAGRAIGNGSGKLGSVYIKVGSAGAGSSTAGTLLNAYVAQDTAQNWYISGTAKLTLTTSSLYTASGVNVGIGTSSPSYKLDVSNNANAFVARFTGGTSSDVNIGLYANTAGAFGSIGTISNHKFQIFTNGNDVAIFDTSGNLGLGVTPSTWAAGRTALEIGGSTTGNIAFNGNATNGYQIWCNSYFNAGSNFYYANGLATNYGSGAGSFFWNIAPNNTSGAGAVATFTRAMTLSDSGNLSLSITPSAFGSTYKAFQAGGYAAYVGDGNNGYAEILNNAYASNNNIFNYYDTNSAGRYSMQLGVHKWFQAGSGSANSQITWTQAMTLDVSGNLLVGVTTTTGSDTAQGIFLYGSAGVVQSNRSSNASLDIGRLTTTGNLAIFRYAGTAVGAIAVTASGTTYQSTLAGQSTGAVLNTSGIGFPATQVASANANTLDDYEEGTWTPVWTGSTSGSGSPGTITGNYVKVGKMVTIAVAMNDANPFITFSGILRCSLPFPAGGTLGSSEYIGPPIYFYNGAQWNTGATTAGITPSVGYGSSNMEFIYMLVNGDRQSPVTNTSSAGLSNGSNVYARFSMTYIVLD
jgi:hypothetical protein